MADPIFYEPLLNVTIGQIAGLTNGVLVDSSLANRPVKRLASLADAGPDALVFIENKRHATDLGSLKAAGVLCTEEIKSSVPKKVAIIVTRHPQQDFAAIGRALYPNAVNAHLWSGQEGISIHAIVHPSAEIENDVTSVDWIGNGDRRQCGHRQRLQAWPRLLCRPELLDSIRISG
jgi:UDP-3-O-[3-hydroxymyristoyl] glucosamine N-acyltransferase